MSLTNYKWWFIHWLSLAIFWLFQPSIITYTLVSIKLTHLFLWRHLWIAPKSFEARINDSTNQFLSERFLFTWKDNLIAKSWCQSPNCVILELCEWKVANKMFTLNTEILITVIFCCWQSLFLKNLDFYGRKKYKLLLATHNKQG